MKPAMPTEFDGVRLTPQEKRKRSLRNYLIGAGVLVFVAFVYGLTWFKIANKTF